MAKAAMGQKRLSVVLTLALVGMVYLAGGFATSSAWVSVPPFMSAFGASVTAAAQDPSAVEAALGFDRPARRLRQGLRNEGFDPGAPDRAPDGLFGLRTRDAVRHWQQARGVPATGYLNREQAELLRASGAPPPPRSENVEPPAILAEGANAPADSASESAAALVAGETALTAQAGQDGDDGRPAAQTTENARELPPEAVVDRHLVRIERLVADEAYGAVLDVINEIVALQEAHDLALEEEFHFTYAQLAFVAGFH